jgi:hypothetical protein
MTNYPIAPGEYDLTVRKAGHKECKKTIDVREGVANSVDVGELEESDSTGLERRTTSPSVSFVRSLFAVESASAGSGFSFDRTVSLVDQELVPSGLPLNLSIRFHGEIALSASCGI